MPFERFDGRAYFPAAQDALDLLEGITAVDAALAVPFVQIYEVGPTGERLRTHPINFYLNQPPAFGSSVDQRFAERPPVSFERLVVRTEQSYGVQLFHRVQLDFVVHRPDFIFSEQEGAADADSWSRLLLPGTSFVVEYGWSGTSRNGIINGEGFSSAERVPGATGGVVVPGRRSLPFVVNTYSFSITPDAEIRVSIKGLENGEHNLRQARIGDMSRFSGFSDDDQRSGRDLRVEADRSARGRKVIEYVQNVLDSIPRIKKRGLGNSVLFGDVLDRLFFPLISEVLAANGYRRSVLRVGNFNETVGLPKPEHCSGKLTSIADFEIPVSRLQGILGTLRKNSQQLTLYNLLEQFFSIMMDPKSWPVGASKVGERAAALRREPNIKVKVTSTRIKGENVAYFYIVDLHSEISKFTQADRLGPQATQQQITAKLRDKGVPVVKFAKGLSYIKDCNFEVQSQDFIKSILIQESLSRSRKDITETPDVASRKGQMDPRQLLYSNAITGDIQMMGNFLFDTFGLVWIDFGVRQWSGTFYVMEREDVIDRSDFLTRLSFRSAGDDPLGTQGRV